MKKFLIIIVWFLIFPLKMYANELPRPFIIDTDVGVDDTIAILYLLQKPTVEVKAISVDGDGNAHCKPALENTRGLLQLVNKLSIPIACGRDLPLKGDHHYPDSVLKESDTLANAPLKIPSLPFPKEHAADLILTTLQKSPEPVEILAIGTMTTIAEVVQKNPAIKNKIKRIYIMGGAIHVKGNIDTVIPTSKNKLGEWNIYIDPYATDIVFKSGIPITLVPLDVTNVLPMDMNFYQLLKQNHQLPAANFVFEMLDNNKNLLQPDKGAYWWYLWDPLTALVAGDSTLCQQQTLNLKVVQTPEDDSGSLKIDPKGSPVQVCLGVTPKTIYQVLVKGLQ